MIRILIVDDHQILRDGLRQMLSEEPEFMIAGDVANGKEAMEWLRTQTVDVVLMDVNMPVMDGVEATARIHKEYPDTRILALTMIEQGSFVQLMLRNGALGYLLKDTSKEEVVAAIRTVAEGKKYLGDHAADLLVGKLGKASRSSISFLPDLTRREKEVLKFITQGMSDTDIANQLYISPTTVESHRKNLRSKLGARNSAEIVRIAMERGLVE
jgi:DNA-binding NarL/FixJ family response regulator